MTAAIERVIEDSVFNFIRELPADWRGREREAVSLFSFGQLVQHCRKGNPPLSDARQIGIEVAVPQVAPGGRRKIEVCKDLVIWDRHSMTCWEAGSKILRHPLAVIEWKLCGGLDDPRRTSCKNEADVKWLVDWVEKASLTHPAIGYAAMVNLHPGERQLVLTRVRPGGDVSKLDQ